MCEQLASLTLERIVFIALGTRGDVQPLATLAEHVRRCHADCNVQLITHAAHRTWLSDQPFYALNVTYIESSPYGLSDSVVAPDENWEQQKACWHAVRQAGGRVAVLVLNLFALEGYHIAEALGVPCVAAAPYQVPYSCPVAFKRRFVAAYGMRLYGMLTEAEGSDKMSWKEVRLWMWPLFTERWWRFRTECLGLAPYPLHDRITHESVTTLPSPVLLLYGFNELLVPQPGHHPRSIMVTSFWQAPRDWLQGMSLPDSILRFSAACQAGNEDSPPGVKRPSEEHTSAATSTSASASTARPGPVCVDVASSGHLGLLPDPSFFLTSLAQALMQIGRHAIVLTSGWQPLEAAAASLPVSLQSRLLLHPTGVPHQLLLPTCCLLMHPGGSGTTAAGLREGCPQLLFPRHYDQPFWAARLEYLGLSPPPLDVTALFGKPPLSPPAAEPESTSKQRDPDLDLDLSSAHSLSAGRGHGSRESFGTSAHGQELALVPGEREDAFPFSQNGAANASEAASAPCGVGQNEGAMMTSASSTAAAHALAAGMAIALSSGIRGACWQMAQDLGECVDGLQAAADIIMEQRLQTETKIEDTNGIRVLAD